MGFAYLGLGSGGVVAPLLVNYLIRAYGWRHALEIVALALMAVLLPVGIWITRSTPEQSGLLPDGESRSNSLKIATEAITSTGVLEAVGTANFWLILLGSTLAIGAVGSVIQHFILFLKDQGYSVTVASVLLLEMARQPVVAWAFALVFGFSMGADYMLIPLVTAESFGTASLGKLLALIIMGYSLGQWGFPWIVGRLFGASHSYDLAWKITALAGMMGGLAIYAVSPRGEKVGA